VATRTPSEKVREGATQHQTSRYGASETFGPTACGISIGAEFLGFERVCLEVQANFMRVDAHKRHLPRSESEISTERQTPVAGVGSHAKVA
jgi:hypothetical protein